MESYSVTRELNEVAKRMELCSEGFWYHCNYCKHAVTSPGLGLTDADATRMKALIDFVSLHYQQRMYTTPHHNKGWLKVPRHSMIRLASFHRIVMRKMAETGAPHMRFTHGELAAVAFLMDCHSVWEGPQETAYFLIRPARHDDSSARD